MNLEVLQAAVRHLKHGGVVIYPTETSYGLGADATNVRAVRAIFKIKVRSSQKSLPLIVGTMRAALRIANFSSRARALSRTYWPGPLTLVLPVRRGAKLAKGVVSRGAVALRISSHPVACALARALGRPLVATSANRAGRPSCYSISAVRMQLGSHLDGALIIDAGPLLRRKPSTIARFKGRGFEILRQGATRL